MKKDEWMKILDELESTEILGQIRDIYGQSLTEVFNECVIVNLDKDYYVNCRTKSLWESHPNWGSYSYVNDCYGRMMIHPNDLHVFRQSFSIKGIRKGFESGKRRIARRLRRKMPDGVYHMAEFVAIHVENMKEDCWSLLVFRDIQEEYEQEVQMTVEMETLAIAAKEAYEMLITVNLTKNTYYMIEYDRYSTQQLSTSGCFDELIEEGVETVAPELREEFVSKFSRKSLLETFEKGQNQVYMELRQMGDDGKYHWNSTLVVRVDNPYTDDVMEITMAKNIDEERRYQEEFMEKESKSKELLKDALKKAEAANSAKSDFMSRMSHDIRTPMNAILGLTTLAQVHLDNPVKIKKYLEQIETAGTHLLGLINEVLDVSKIESGKMQVEGVEFELVEAIREVELLVQPVCKAKKQSLYIQMQPDIWTHLQGDQQKLRQILVNLLDNASKYSSEGQKISLFVSENAKDNTSMGTYRFVVEDHGIGMKEEYLEHIFEPFSRAEESSTSVLGTGLGLTIVHNIVNMLGGTIEIESQYGKGSRFIVTLCIQKSKCKNVEVPVQKDSSPRKKDDVIRVLLVEDNEINQQIAMEMLKLLGAEVELAENGQEAVDKIMEKPMFYYKLVFMDIQMPVMNGYDATIRIRKHPNGTLEHLPIIAMTADAFSEDIKKCRMAGMNEHLAKPISMEKLKKILAEFGRT